MEKDVRREELGKFFLDVAKYVLTVVVIGTLVSTAIDVRALAIGFGIGVVLTAIGYWTLPPKTDDRKGAA